MVGLWLSCDMEFFFGTMGLQPWVVVTGFAGGGCSDCYCFQEEREREREIDYKYKKIKKEYLNKVGKNKTFNVWCIIKCGVKQIK